MRARDLMTSDPVCVEADCTMRLATELMRENDLRHLPVVEGGDLIGMLSDRDVREYLPYTDQQVGADTNVEQSLEDPVTAAMRSDLLCVTPESELSEVIDLMIEWKVGAVPVVEQGSERLVGIVSYIDVLAEARARL